MTLTFAVRACKVPDWFQMPCIACEITGDDGRAVCVVTATSGLGLAACPDHTDVTQQVLRTLRSYELAGLRTSFVTAGLTAEPHPSQTLTAAYRKARDAAAKAGPTEGDKLRAALTAFGIPSFFADDRGVTYVLVAIDRTANEEEAHTGPRVFLHSGEDAMRPADQHTQPWTASLYAADGSYIDEPFVAEHGLPLDEECATAALTMACWLTAHAHRYPREQHRDHPLDR
ncbi:MULTISPECIES: hypothetical protein [unclassified Streptomyces]|uniref:hypothetical protein n=1 Tax=unclassified Streptomyces TaxID=2593676 RepID=UPI00277FF148|nr:hypothetical protein [Streptomyces sp. B4I13]MDQ0961987.1 hypothetical protein [Streptomyces sp. B4I13]